MRKKCKLDPEIKSFDDLKKIMDDDNVALLKKTYESIEDIDLYVGGALETFKKFTDEFAGPTFTCIMLEGYKRLISADAYYYTHSTSPYPFTPAQLSTIKEHTLGYIMCKTTNIEYFPKSFFRVEEKMSEKVMCKDLKIDLKAWANI